MGLFNIGRSAKKSIQSFVSGRNISEIIGYAGLDIFGNSSKSQQLNYFLQVPELYQVITTKAKMHAKMNLTVRSKITNKELDNNNALRKVLKNPNWQNTQKEFLTLDKIFREIYGNDYIHFLIPEGFSKKSVKQMSALNPLNLELKEPTGGLPPFMRREPKDGTKYIYSYENKTYDIPFSDVLHLNNSNVKSDSLTSISPIESIKPILENIKAAYESRGVLLRTRGAIGVLSNSAKDQNGVVLGFDDKEVEKLQDEYKRYGTLRNQWQILISSLTLKWQPMIQSTKELMLFEEIEADFQKVCDVYGFNSLMFSSVKGSTFENAKQYERQSYQNTIIPEAQEFINGLNDYFETEKESYVIVGEFENLHVFDEDKETRANTIVLTTNYLSQQFTDGAITLQQYQQELAKWGVGEKPM